MAPGAAVMWGSLLAGIIARPWAMRTATIALVALKINFLIFNLCRTIERAGRAAEQLDMRERMVPFGNR